MSSHFSIIMKRFAVVASVLTILFAAAYRISPRGWILSGAITVGTTAYHLLMRLAVGYLLPKLTNYDFDYRSPWFRSKTWEPTFYQKLQVKQWKGKLPTYAPSQFSLTEQTMLRVIQNMCGAELVHEIIMVLSFLPLLAVPAWGEFYVFLITSLSAALFDSIFVMAQRYNRPRLVRIYERQEAKMRE